MKMAQCRQQKQVAGTKTSAGGTQMKKFNTRIRLSGDSRLNHVHGCVTTTSLSEGKQWVSEIYDGHPRFIRGSFGEEAVPVRGKTAHEMIVDASNSLKA
jgi:hypothetical protein